MEEKFPGHAYAGITDVTRLGVGVEANAVILHRFAYLERQMLHLMAGSLIHVPEWEVKFLLGRHLYEDAEHHNLLRKRIGELRRSERSVDHAPDPALEALIDEFAHSGDTIELLAGLYGAIKPALVASMRAHLEKINPLVDYNTGRVLRLILLEEEEQVLVGQQFLESLLTDDAEREKAAVWQNHLLAYLAAAGGVDGTMERTSNLPAPHSDGQPHRLPLDSRRDERFQVTIPKNPATHVEETGDRTREGLEQMMWVRFNELSPAETVGAIIYLEQGKPWDFYYDLARHCWDEVRHAAFGQAALEAEGISITRNPNWIGFAEMALSSMDPIDAYTHLTVAIEQAAMKYPPGKRQEYEFCRDVAKHKLMALFQDYDWADEVVHSHFGQEWVIKNVYHGDRKAAIAAGQATVDRRAAFFSKFINDDVGLDPISLKSKEKGSAAGY